jgi:hypothetical protein
VEEEEEGRQGEAGGHVVGLVVHACAELEMWLLTLADHRSQLAGVRPAWRRNIYIYKHTGILPSKRSQSQIYDVNVTDATDDVLRCWDRSQRPYGHLALRDI